MQDKNLFWQVRIHITQAPHPYKPEPLQETEFECYQEITNIRTFLGDPFKESPPRSYGIEITAHHNILYLHTLQILFQNN